MFCDRSKIVGVGLSQSDEYYANLYYKNCQILKKVELLPDTWKDKKKRELTQCVHCLKKWKASSATYALESCTKTFMDTINAKERKAVISSEIEKSNKITEESSTLYKIMERGLLYNERNLSSIRNTFIKKEDEKNDLECDFCIYEKKGTLAFERLNKLIKLSEEGEKEIKKLLHLKKSGQKYI